MILHSRHRGICMLFVIAVLSSTACNLFNKKDKSEEAINNCTYNGYDNTVFKARAFSDLAIQPYQQLVLANDDHPFNASEALFLDNYLYLADAVEAGAANVKVDIAGEQADLTKCSVCVFAKKRVGSKDKLFAAAGGHLVVSAPTDTGGTFEVTATDLRLVEIDRTTLTPLAGGDTWCFDKLEVASAAEPWLCDYAPVVQEQFFQDVLGINGLQQGEDICVRDAPEDKAPTYAQIWTCNNSGYLVKKKDCLASNTLCNVIANYIEDDSTETKRSAACVQVIRDVHESSAAMYFDARVRDQHYIEILDNAKATVLAIENWGTLSGGVTPGQNTTVTIGSGPEFDVRTGAVFVYAYVTLATDVGFFFAHSGQLDIALPQTGGTVFTGTLRHAELQQVDPDTSKYLKNGPIIFVEGLTVTIASTSKWPCNFADSRQAEITQCPADDASSPACDDLENNDKVCLLNTTTGDASIYRCECSIPSDSSTCVLNRMTGCSPTLTCDPDDNVARTAGCKP